MNEHGDYLHTTREETLNAQELKLLLERLQSVPADPIAADDDHATVAAVCELTGEPEYKIWEILDSIRQDDIEARIADKLRELEEPLYRVERPGFSYDPLASYTPGGRRHAFKSVLDNVPRKDRKLPGKEQRTTLHDHAHSWIATIFLLLTFVLLLALVGRALIQALVK